MLPGAMSYCAKLTGEDLSRYFIITESVGLKKSLLLVPDWRSDCKSCKMFTSPCPTSWQPKQQTDRNEEITLLSHYVFLKK